MKTTCHALYEKLLWNLFNYLKIKVANLVVNEASKIHFYQGSKVAGVSGT